MEAAERLVCTTCSLHAINVTFIVIGIQCNSIRVDYVTNELELKNKEYGIMQCYRIMIQ